MKPLFRSLIFSLLLVYISNQPWDIVSKQPVIPFNMFQSILVYVSDKILGKGTKSRFPQILQIFIDTPSLRFLAVPPKLGGPQNQYMYLIIGFANLFTILFVSFPNSVFQFIGFILAISSTFGYWMSLHHFRFYEYYQMPLITYVWIIVSLLGIVTIISDPIELIKSLVKKNKKEKQE